MSRLNAAGGRGRAIGVAIAAVALSLLVLELVVRVLYPQWSDPWKIWRIDPVHARGVQRNVRDAVVHAHSGEFAFRFDTNAQGLRMDRDLAEATERRRALFVGDSFTFGYGVDQGETFVDRVRRRLEVADVPVEAINAGFASGFTIDTEYVFTREVGAGWGPELVVAGVCLSNDLEDLDETRWRIDGERLVSIAKPRDWLPETLKRSGLLNLVVKGAWPRLRAGWASRGRDPGEAPERSDPCRRGRARSDARPARAGPVDPPARSASEVARASRADRVDWVLRHWARHAADRGYDLVLLFVPDAGEVQWPATSGEMARHAAVRDVFAAAAERAGVRVVDPAAAMRDHYCSTREPLYYAVDGHWNRAGHRFVGDWLAAELFDLRGSPGAENERESDAREESLR